MLFQNIAQMSLFFQIRGTIITRIYAQVICYTIYVTTILILHHRIHHLGVMNNIIGALGIIISLLLGFRTNDAHTRYNEARKVWGRLKMEIRNIARIIWVYAPAHRARQLICKKSAINLLDTFCHALKHYLRQEYSDTEPDLQPLIKQIPKFEFHPQKIPKKSISSKIDEGLAYDFRPPANIPHEILYQLRIYAKVTVDSSPSINPIIWLGVTESISKLEKSLSELEALQRTPLPICYSSHLSHIFWIYLLLLPFQILEQLSWWTIPILGITFFIFEGCIRISNEIENPFGYDYYNDLPLDNFCWVIRKELSQITAERTPEFTKWTISENTPLYPYDRITAEEWSTKSLDDARNLLFNLKYNTDTVEHGKEWEVASVRVIDGTEGNGDLRQTV